MGVHRRGVTVAAAVIAALLTVTACSSAGGGEKPGTGGRTTSGAGPLTVLVNLSPQYPEKQRQWFERIKDRFKQRTGAEVQFETFASAAEEQKKIQTAVAAGTGPDVYSLGTTFTPVAFATGAFLEMGPAEWQAIGGKDRFLPATLGMSGPDGNRQVGIPYLSRPFVMAYNTKMFAAAGISGPPTSWDQLVSYAKQLTKGDVFGMTIAYGDNFDPWKFAWMFANQYGNPLIDGKKARLDDPTLRRAFDAYFGFLTRDKIVNPAAAGWSSAQSLAAFASGKAAMMLMTGPGAVPTLDGPDSAVKGDYAFAKMPDVPPGVASRPEGGRPATTILSGDNIAIAGYSKNQDLALKYVELVTSPIEQVNYTNTFGDLPANAQAAKVITESNSPLAPIIAAGTSALPTPFTGAWSEVQLALTNVVAQSRAELAGPAGVPPAALDQRLAEAQTSAQSALDRAG